MNSDKIREPRTYVEETPQPHDAAILFQNPFMEVPPVAIKDLGEIP